MGVKCTFFIAFCGLVLVIASHALSVETLDLPAIYGGNLPPAKKFKYVLYLLRIYDNRTRLEDACTAFLITPEWAVTAAHCLQGENFHVFLAAGSTDITDYHEERKRLPLEEDIDPVFGFQERRALKSCFHPQYDSKSLSHDVGLILVKPFEETQVEPIPLAQEKLLTPRNCTMVGWGLTNKWSTGKKLNSAEARVGRSLNETCISKKENSFCVLPPPEVGICEGDSGGPLVCDDRVWGVASFVHPENQRLEDSDKCMKGFGSYYLEVHSELKWIKEVMQGNDNDCSEYGGTEKVQPEQKSSALDLKSSNKLFCFFLVLVQFSIFS